jgi:hypothetical protein
MRSERALDAIASTDRAENFEVVVLFTTVRETLTALKTAGELVNGLHAHIRLLVPQIVPYPLPLDEPPVSEAFLQQRFCPLVEKASLTARLDIRLCRDRWQMLQHVLAPGSLVVLCRFRRWLPSRERGLARRLKRLGHRVLFLSEEE